LRHNFSHILTIATNIVKKLENFADRLKAARRLAGLGQAQLAHKLGVSGGAVGNWEAGPKQPTAENLGKIAVVLGVTTGWLIHGEASGEHPMVSGARQPYAGSMANNRTEDAAELAAATRQKILTYVEKIIESIDGDRPRLAWLLCELEDKFPLKKFTKEKTRE